MAHFEITRFFSKFYHRAAPMAARSHTYHFGASLCMTPYPKTKTFASWSLYLKLHWCDRHSNTKHSTPTTTETLNNCKIHTRFCCLLHLHLLSINPQRHHLFCKQRFLAGRVKKKSGKIKAVPASLLLFYLQFCYSRNWFV